MVPLWPSISLLSKPGFSLQQSAGLFDLFFSQTVTGTLCSGCQEVRVSARGTPRGVLVAKWDMLKLQSQQRKMCANTLGSPVTSQKLCKKM